MNFIIKILLIGIGASLISLSNDITIEHEVLRIVLQFFMLIGGILLIYCVGKFGDKE